MNIYNDSFLNDKVKKYKKIAFLDIDLSLTGEPEVQSNIRTSLEDQNFAIVFVTSRPCELLLSNQSLNNSPAICRPQTKTMVSEDGKRYHIDLAENQDFKGLIDPDAIAGTTGMHIYVKSKKNNYLQDQSYYPLDINPSNWRKKVFELFIKLRLDTSNLNEIEVEGEYEKNKTDIAPPDFRIQLNFNDLESKLEFEKSLSTADKDFALYVLDDSEPENHVYSIYLFPINAATLKKDAVDHIFNNVCQSTKLNPKDIEVLIVGDSFPDLAMGLDGAQNAKATFFIPSGSRLTSIFTNNVNEFAGIDVTQYTAHIQKTEKGKYIYNKRFIYVGSELTHQKFGASTLEFLQNFYFK